MEEDGTRAAPKRKLIEVALPLEAINRESGREKRIRHGHPSTLHLWWARRPLVAARAVLFAQLVDDPSAHPDRFPTDEAQAKERKRLHALIERLAVWENTHDQALLHEAHREILASTHGNPPPVLDPFAGGGTIPLEAQRLGLVAHANDLNPLAVLLNTVLIELTDRFELDAPVTGGMACDTREALAEDLRSFASRLQEQVARRVGHLYPKPSDGADPLVYFWARTVRCPNPACQAQVPLVGSWTLSSKKGSEAYLSATYVPDERDFVFRVMKGRGGADGSMSRQGGMCPACESTVPLAYIKEEGVAGRLGAKLLAMQARSAGTRAFIVADEAQRVAAQEVPDVDVDFLDAELSTHSQYMAPPRYGLTRFQDLFSPRQLAMLVAFVEGLDELQAQVLQSATEAGLADDGVSYAGGGRGAAAYADAIRILMALGIGRLVNRQSTLCIWDAGATKVNQVFSRQAYSMTWLFAEANPFAGASGSFSGQIGFLAKALTSIAGGTGTVTQGPAQDLDPPRGVVVSTDPPYYDNVPYADLADFFIVWHRRMLQRTLPLFQTVLSPKSEELVADHVRLGGKDRAKEFFEAGFERVFTQLARVHTTDAPMTVYYAFRQSDTSADGRSSTGWETVLEGLIRAGWLIDGTWPMRTEQAGGLRALGRNALASSVVVVCRLRDSSAGSTDVRGLFAALREELPDALRKLQQGAIAPVDLPQAAIGPGMAVFTRFSKVIEDDGSPMTVRSALARINGILDQVLNEQEGDFDSTTRFAIAWYRQSGYGTGQFGDADNVARARNTSVEALHRDGILSSLAGKVTLLDPASMPENYDPASDDRISAWEVLHNLIASLERGGLPEAGALLADAIGRPDGAIDSELVKELAFLLFSIAEKNGWTKDALAFNTVATAWPDIVAASGAADQVSGTQAAFAFEDEG